MNAATGHTRAVLAADDLGHLLRGGELVIGTTHIILADIGISGILETTEAAVTDVARGDSRIQQIRRVE